MTLVELASLGAGVAQWSTGVVAAGKQGTIRVHNTLTPVTIYVDETGTSTYSTDGTFTTDGYGRVPGWATLGLIADITIPPASIVTAYVGGPPGPTGPAGPTGPPSTFRGAWSSATTYAAGDIVSYTTGGATSSYASLVGSNVNHRPDISPSQWGLAASAGSFPFVSVDNLSTTPRSVTDWGPIINTAISAGVRRFVFGPFDYPFATMIAAHNIPGVILEGAAGNNWYDQGTGKGFTRLIWGGTGAGNAIDFASSALGPGGNVGPVLRDLQLLYSSNSYTGKLVNYNDGGFAVAERCYFGPSTGSGAASADHALELGGVNTFHAISCTFGMKAAHGRDASHTFSNIVRFTECTFDVRAATNPGLEWLFDHCDFEFPNLPSGDAFITTDGFTYNSGDPSGRVTLRDCTTWDASGGTQYLVNIPSGIPVHVKVDGLEDSTGNTGALAMLINHQGTGDLWIERTSTSQIIDCGDGTVTGTPPPHQKQICYVVGNNFLSFTVTNLLRHTSAHLAPTVRDNSTPFGNNVALQDSFQTSGHRRADAATTPTLALHTGVTGLTLALISGNDDDGFIMIQNTAGAASPTGLIVDVTMANPPASLRPSGQTYYQFALVDVFPFVADDSGNAYNTANGPASAACQPYGYAKSVRVGSQGAWSLGIGVGIPAGAWVGFGYRVIHL